jgi:hypothetical protein
VRRTKELQHGLNIRNDVNSKYQNHIEIGPMCHFLHTNKIGNYINVLKLQNKPKLVTLENKKIIMTNSDPTRSKLCSCGFPYLNLQNNCNQVICRCIFGHMLDKVSKLRTQHHFFIIEEAWMLIHCTWLSILVTLYAFTPIDR